MDARRLGPVPLVRGGLGVLVVLLAAWAAFSAWAQPSHALDPGPSADFTLAPIAPLVGETVVFTGEGLPEPGAELSSYRWDLDGDGSFELNAGLVPAATTVYTVPGTYTVTFQMRDTYGNRANRSRVLVVGGQAPLASFTVAPGAPLANQPVQFTSTASDPDGAIVDQAWDLNGDGVFDNGGGPTAMRSFAAPGQYVIGLRVTDNEAHTSFSSQAVSVAGLPGIRTPGLTLRLLNPFPVVRISGSLTKRGARLRTVGVDAPPGSTIRVGCTGRSCPYRTRTSVVSKRSGSIRLSRLERRLRAGVQIRIFVTSPGTIGKYASFKIRRGKPPQRVDGCVHHGSARPVACQAS